MTTADVVVSLFGGRRLPRSLRGLPTVSLDDIDACKRVIVVGCDADLATVLTRLLRTDRLDVEVAHTPNSRTARRAISGVAWRVPLIRDETGTVVVGAAEWTGSPARTMLHGEAVVDDAVCSMARWPACVLSRCSRCRGCGPRCYPVAAVRGAG